MACYENYLCLEVAKLEDDMPTAFSADKWKLERQATTATGKPKVKDGEPVMEQYIPKFKDALFSGKLGAPRYSADGKYVLIKGEFSNLLGEMSALKDLGKNKSYPANAILTKTEAQKLVGESHFTNE